MTSLYIHIPFCKQKCNYCDFVSYAGKEELIDEYVKSLIRELEPLLSTFDYQLSTVYFGGGTPTLLSPKHLDKIISTLIEHCKLKIENSEISIEANPGTANKTKLKELRQLGINRLSMGVQSFNDIHLKTLGRIHDAKTALKFYEDARAAGFDNINLDLIFALPNQTLAEWQQDLKTAISIAPEHLSCYCLEGKMAQHNEDLELAMYEHTINTLTKAGFEHYEISNFARPGFECQHNIVYWKNENYFGIGAGAHSHVDGKRWANPNSIEDYLNNAPRISHNDSHLATAQRETLFMGLRLLKGLPSEKFQGFEQEVAELIESGLLIRENSHIKLTKKGLYLANEVFERFV